MKRSVRRPIRRSVRPIVIHFKKNEELIDIRMDNVFKAVFTKDTPESRGALSALLSALTGRRLVVIAITANEPPVDNLRDRQIRFDITCRAEDGELVNVEMSLNPDACEPVRLEFHAGKLFTGQDIRGADKSYDDLKAAYQVAILAERRFFKDGEFLHNFEYYDAEKRMPLGGRSRIVTVELAKLEEVIEKSAGDMSASEHWAVFFEYLTDKTMREKINEVVKSEEGIAMAGKVLLEISRDEQERVRLMSEYKYELDTQSRIVDAKREG
ncbi:MAG: Rpn family recombination-promoting nuclease/putative transposase, partial [Spirochaetales bacterium]|nr:Rpn family recombination-promoting nuclease/putative transposase [Spirochaetales bacterium]